MRVRAAAGDGCWWPGMGLGSFGKGMGAREWCRGKFICPHSLAISSEREMGRRVAADGSVRCLIRNGVQPISRCPPSGSRPRSSFPSRHRRRCASRPPRSRGSLSGRCGSSCSEAGPIHGVGRGCLSCVDAASGKKVWVSEQVDRTLATAAIAEGLTQSFQNPNVARLSSRMTSTRRAEPVTTEAGRVNQPRLRRQVGSTGDDRAAVFPAADELAAASFCRRFSSFFAFFSISLRRFSNW
jgi:hypothetical protein